MVALRPGDGFLAYKELESLARHTSGTLPEEDYIALCATLGADPLKGLAEPDLLKVYAELAWGDVRHDFKMLKLGPQAQSGDEATPEPEPEPEPEQERDEPFAQASALRSSSSYGSPAPGGGNRSRTLSATSSFSARSGGGGSVSFRRSNSVSRHAVAGIWLAFFHKSASEIVADRA